MTLAVEDGSVVAGADSYVTVAEFKQFATDRGETAAAEADDDQVEGPGAACRLSISLIRFTRT